MFQLTAPGRSGQAGPTATPLAATASKHGHVTAVIQCLNMEEKIVPEVALAPWDVLCLSVQVSYHL